MYIHLISDRVYNGYYHTFDSIYQDISHIHLNCFLYNEPESIFCKDVQQVLINLTNIVQDQQNMLIYGNNAAKRIKQAWQQQDLIINVKRNENKFEQVEE